MRLHNFFISERIGDSREVSVTDPNLLHQWLKVFRLGKGSGVVLLDNSGLEFVSQFISLSKARAELLILERRKNKHIPAREIFLHQSLVKKDAFEWIAEKATELGVSGIVPILSDRSEKKNLNARRVQKIMKEASEQSGRGTLPTLMGTHTLSSAISLCEGNALVFHPDAEKFSLENFSAEKEKALSLFIGPEGGWSENEIEMFREAKIPLVSLGSPTLKAETAVIAALSLMLLPHIDAC